jgi:hypothetical protein
MFGGLLYSSAITIPARDAASMGAIWRLTILSHLPIIQNCALIWKMAGRFVGHAIKRRILGGIENMAKKTKSLPALKAKAWKLLSECIRREAADESGMVRCYTSGQLFHWKEIQAGHAIPGRTGAVLFDEEIIRPQSYRENVALRGNYPVFTAKLIREKAFAHDESSQIPPLVAAMDWWESKLLSAKQIKKWSRPELEELIEGYKERLARL